MIFSRTALCADAVAHTSNSLNGENLGIAFVCDQLFSNALNTHIDHIGLRIEAEIPHVLQDLLA
jgi:hypothetical protein